MKRITDIAIYQHDNGMVEIEIPILTGNLKYRLKEEDVELEKFFLTAIRTPSRRFGELPKGIDE